eukprot:GHVS01029380.1.p2 GENE.GHVS01029380.1~~GHVS01029380.1.p2  ORF type:complete len:112 (+),score=18.62 GHVS01029380.1:882-1217(+)
MCSCLSLIPSLPLLSPLAAAHNNDCVCLYIYALVCTHTCVLVMHLACAVWKYMCVCSSSLYFSIYTHMYLCVFVRTCMSSRTFCGPLSLPSSLPLFVSSSSPPLCVLTVYG